MRSSAFDWMKKLKRLRGGALDLFRKTGECRGERGSIEEESIGYVGFGASISAAPPAAVGRHEPIDSAGKSHSAEISPRAVD